MKSRPQPTGSATPQQRRHAQNAICSRGMVQPHSRPCPRQKKETRIHRLCDKTRPRPTHIHHLHYRCPKDHPNSRPRCPCQHTTHAPRHQQSLHASCSPIHHATTPPPPSPLCPTRSKNLPPKAPVPPALHNGRLRSTPQQYQNHPACLSNPKMECCIQGAHCPHKRPGHRRGIGRLGPHQDIFRWIRH